MAYLIVKTYGQQWPEYHTATTGAKTPAAYDTIEQLAENLKQQQKRQADFVASNPRDNRAARLAVVAVDRVPGELLTKPEHATRPLSRVETQRMAQLVPGFK